MKNLKYIILCFLAFVTLGLEAQNPVFSLPTGLQTTVGETISVQLVVDVDLTSYDVLAYKFAFSYNSSLLAVKSVQYDTKLDAFTNVANTQQSGKVTLTGASTSKIQGSGTLITITFEALASGTATLSFVTAECLLNEGTPTATYQNGSITIAAKPVITISPNTVLLAVGQTTQCSVSGNKTAPCTWGVTDTNVASVLESGLITGVAHGRTKVFVEDAAGLRDTTDGFFNVTAIKLYFPSGLQQWQGWEVTIPVKTTDFSSVNVVSGQFALSYNSTVLQFLGTETSGTLLENSSVSATEIQSGKISLAFASAQALGFTSDELVGLRFKVLPTATATTSLTFSDVVFNEDISAVSENGTFTPKILPTLSVTPTSGSLVAGDSLLFTASNGIEPYTWSVSDERVAKIRQNGWLVANEGGTTDVTVTDSVGATKTISGIQVYDMRMYFPVDTLESVGDTTYTRCLVDSIPIGRPAISAIQGDILVSNSNVKILDIETEGTFAEGWQKIITRVSDQRIKFYLAGATPFRQKGIAFYLKTALLPAFKEYDRSNISFANMQVNEGTPNPLFINGSLEGKLFTDQDKTLCLGESTGELVAHGTEGKTISKWQKRIRGVTAWVNVANTDSVYIDTPDALGEWEYSAVIDGVLTKVANILVVTIPDISGKIQGDTVFCNVPQTLQYVVERRPTATEYHWNYRGEGVVLHPNGNILDLEITNEITPGYLVMRTTNSCGESADSLILNLHPIIQPASFTFKSDTIYFNRDTVSFTDTSIGALTWNWSISPATGSVFVEGTNAESQHPKIQFTQAGTYRVKLETTNSCRLDSASQTVVINQFENGTVILDNSSGCLGTTFKAKLTQSNGSVNVWQVQTDGETDWTDLPLSNLDSTTYTPTSAGTYHIRAKLNYDRGYSNTETIIVYPTYNLSEEFSICSGSDYAFPDGTEISNIMTDTTYVSSLQTSYGCDSIITTNLRINPTYNLTDSKTICQSELPYTYRDTIFAIGTTSGEFIFHRNTVNGCDSIVTLDLVVHPTYNISIRDSICASDVPYILGTQSLTTSGEYSETFQTVNGCDSIVNLNLRVIESPNVNVTKENATLTVNLEGATYQWIDCDNENAPIEGETGQSFTPTVSGHYAVVITSETCTATSSCYEVIITAIKNIFGDEFKLYPNPTNGYINIDFGENIPELSLIITDITGRTLFTHDYKNSEYLKLNLHHLSSGIYFIQITKENKTATFKVIKNKL